MNKALDNAVTKMHNNRETLDDILIILKDNQNHLHEKNGVVYQDDDIFSLTLHAQKQIVDALEHYTKYQDSVKEALE